MGWWEVKGTDDVIGDDVADELIEGFRRLDRKPTFQELLDATAAIMSSDGDELFADRDFKGAIRAVFEGSGDLTGKPGNAGKDLKAHLEGVYGKVTAAYESALDRKPRRSELLAGLAFLLRVDPQDHLSEAEEARLDRFEIAT